MGVADNRSYKDEYLFTDDVNHDTGKDQPSIHQEPKINTTIKDNPYRSNVEIEGGEIVLQPDLTALFKASGKKHSQGGMDVLLKPDSFIFSDFKGLAFKQKDYDLFEFKEGGSVKDSTKNTPAEVLKRNIDVKHYNSLVNILQDPYKDDLAKKSSARMLEKYLQTLGNIAYVQEEKKGFPQGIPAFSMGTAPVYNTEVKDQIMENKQYMKAGGTTGNPYMQAGGSNRKPKNPNAVYDPITGRWYNPQDAPMTIPTNRNPWDPIINIPTGRGTALAPVYKGSSNDTITPPPQNDATRKVEAARQVANQPMWGLWQGDKMPLFQDRYGLTNAADKFEDLKDWNTVAKELGYTGAKNNLDFQKWLYNSSPENKAIIDKWHGIYSKGPTAGMFDSKIGIRWANALRDIRNRRPEANRPTEEDVDLHTENPFVQPKGPQAPNLEITPQGSKQADWRFTPWQQMSHLNNLAQFANVRRYMPYRSRYNATYVDPALVNPEQAIGDLKGFGNQQLSSIGTLNPILRNAQAASIAGQVMNQVPGVRSQYDNQNANILNQTRQFNNQVKNNESLVNLGFDQQYYREAIEGRKNFDNMRQYTWNQYANNIFRDVETNQKLAYNLLTQNNPAYGFDWKTGNFTRNKKSIMDAQNPSNTQENLLELADKLKTMGYGEKLIGDILKTKAFQTWNPAQTPNFFQKKGGKMTRNPYK